MSVYIEVEKIGGAKAWIAEIVGPDSKYKLAREFVGNMDYSRKNRPGTRGIYCCHHLEEGKIYELCGGHSWGSAGERRFVAVRAGEIVKLGMEEVLAEIGSRSESPVAIENPIERSVA